MPHPNHYVIEIRGRATERVLHPVVDEFVIEPTDHGTTRLVGAIRDPSHLNGLLAHFTSMNVEVVELHSIDAPPPLADSSSHYQPTSAEKGNTS